MGIFFPSNQTQELDPDWQRRRQVILGLLAILSLIAAVALVVHFSQEHDAQTEGFPPAEDGIPIGEESP